MKTFNRIMVIMILTALMQNCQFNQPAETIIPAKLFSDHMVLQQDMPIPVWGTADPNGIVTVIFMDQKAETISDKKGKWMVKLKPVKAGGPFQMNIIGKDTLLIDDILVGEVWLGSGQSNMEMPLAGWGRVLNFEQEIQNADYPQIRLFQVQRSIAVQPVTDIPAEGWQVCSPQTIAEFSATAYFFGRELHKQLNIPIGLIHSSWGGTIIEAWMSEESLQGYPEFSKTIQKLRQIDSLLRVNKQNEEPANYEEIMAVWQKEIIEKDRGLKNGKAQWASPELQDGDWPEMELPTTWENAGLPGLDGIVWFRKEINIPSSWAGKELTLCLSAVDDIDSTYFNGEVIGGTFDWDDPREYKVPASLVQSGRNVIAVRVQDNQGGGGIWGKADLLKIKLAAKEPISLVGKWKYNVGLDWNELEYLPVNPNNPNLPTLLSNGMLDPLIPYAIRGAIWYQGESNDGRAYQYRSLFKDMIRDWRKRWEQGDFPFMFVQLANYMQTSKEPAEHTWAELREAQLMALTEPNTGMAVTIDIGDALDIHPKNKQEVGRRLALNALHSVYGLDLVPCGPIYKSMKINGDKIYLNFDYIAEGLLAKDKNKLVGFAIAGENRQFLWAQAEIKDNQVVVWNNTIKNPVAVRYGWDANPVCNLYNSAGLPASPFRTDDWPGITWPQDK
ncbi:MAG: hypothetical protein JXR46_07565 [Calditrichaceae bacterium]|nr:hypothetical protein [Calditrichaceae bacterium]MBN2708886.1 hypothetical protein [Calditrichaceae bacterium]RQV97589.1 MAG: 9-O-acetylesterase [Calditrichota bacterium]